MVYSFLFFPEKPRFLSEEVSPSSSTLTYQWTKHETIVIFCEVTHTDSSSTEKAVSNKAKISIKTCNFYKYMYIYILELNL